MTCPPRRLLLAALLTACPDKPGTTATDGSTGGVAGSSSTGGAPTTAGPSPTSTSTASATSGGDPSSAASTTASTDGGEPVCPSPQVLEVGTGPLACDPLGQDCPPCEKCAAFGEGDGWTANKCVPVVPDPAAVGEPCKISGGPFSGVDDCDLGAMCFHADEQGHGTCVALCSGSPETPTCADPDDLCGVFNDGALTLCLDRCDPLVGSCPDGDVCVPSLVGAGFLCIVDVSGTGGQLHGACETINGCDPGLLCVGSAKAAECDPQATGCCVAYCDLTVPDPASQCSGAGQACVGVFAPDPAPAGDEDVGICVVP